MNIGPCSNRCGKRKVVVNTSLPLDSEAKINSTLVLADLKLS